MSARRSTKRRDEARKELNARVSEGKLDLADALRLMRVVAGKSQAEYAKLVGVSPRVLIDFERGVGNPTVRTLEKLFAPFGFALTVGRRGSEG